MQASHFSLQCRKKQTVGKEFWGKKELATQAKTGNASNKIVHQNSWHIILKAWNKFGGKQKMRSSTSETFSMPC